jgi:hypothetical protein
MKKRIVLVLMLVAVFLLPGGTAPALADGMRGVTGGIYMFVPQWGDLRVWLTFDVHELDPDSHAATGIVRAQLFSPNDGWKRLDFRAECVKFDTDAQGKQTAVFIVEILRKDGWGQGLPGEHGRFWVRDGGTPGTQGDQWINQSYSLDPWIEYWPTTLPAPDCESFTPDQPPPEVMASNLVIH